MKSYVLTNFREPNSDSYKLNLSIEERFGYIIKMKVV